MTLQDFLQTRYVRGGRAAPDLDCWGLVRLARVHLFGRPLLPAFSETQPGEVRSITRHVLKESMQGFVLCDPKPGAIATCWQGSVCPHVGIVVEADARLWVLETDAPTGPILRTIPRFQARFARVLFYDDPDLPRADAQSPH